MKRRVERLVQCAPPFGLHRLSSNKRKGKTFLLLLGPEALQQLRSFDELRVDEGVGREWSRGGHVGWDEGEADKSQEGVEELELRVGRVDDEEKVADVVEEDDSEGIDAVVDARVHGSSGARVGVRGEVLGGSPLFEPAKFDVERRGMESVGRSFERLGVGGCVLPPFGVRLADARYLRVPKSFEIAEDSFPPCLLRLAGLRTRVLLGAEEVELDDGLEGGESALGEAYKRDKSVAAC